MRLLVAGFCLFAVVSAFREYTYDGSEMNDEVKPTERPKKYCLRVYLACRESSSKEACRKEVAKCRANNKKCIAECKIENAQCYVDNAKKHDEDDSSYFKRSSGERVCRNKYRSCLHSIIYD